MKLDEENKSFMFKNRKCNLIVDFYDNSKCLKVSMEDVNTKEMTEITMSGVELFIPQPPTPDCVIVNNKENKELIEKLLELKILDYCNTIFAKFNMNKLYEYDKQGTMKFLDYHTVRIEYEENKGNTIDEVKSNIEKDVKKVLKDKSNKKILSEKYNFNNAYPICYLINTNNPKESFAICADEKREDALLLKPYIKNKSLKFRIIDYYNFNFDDHFFNYVQNGYEISKVSMQAHYAIWSQIEEWYPYDIENKKGMQKYLKYCKDNNITKEKIDKACGTSMTIDIMKYYQLERKNKKKNRDLSL